MEIPSKYNSSESEKKWYQYWLDNKMFESKPDDREPYTVVIPPPNVTGVLHMGHMLNNTIQDVLVRRARMQGKNACWVPGTDHASIATESKVVKKLAAEGIDKNSLSRDEFLEHAWEWKEKHGGMILKQLRKLGASCDWDRTKFTMDDDMSASVIKVFVDLFQKGLIYRGTRMVNWDPKAKTAVSDEEVIYKEEQSKLYYLRYKIEGEDNFVTIATTRPETILGDTAVCVNPNDERFAHLHGKKVIVPLVNRAIPIIQDEYVDMEFGTGCLKITPAHDINDNEIGKRHNLETIDIFNDDATHSEAAGFFVGKDRFEVRKLIVPELEEAGNVVKIEDYANKVGYSERTDVVIEPRLSAQWFLGMKKLAEPALENVMNDNVKFHPAKFKNVYRHWMENVRDWNISRQLWWGQRIPAFYYNNDNFVVAETAEEALVLARKESGNTNLQLTDLRQDEDVLDTWFSSWLWPISVFNGINDPENADMQYYYPTNDLVTGPDIIFFWVARMIVAGYEYKDELPFKNVYFTGIVRDAQRRKMSKSLGNSPDPLDLIEASGADSVRVGMLLSTPAGNDLLFDETLIEQGRNFGNKIWNAFRLINMWEPEQKAQPESAKASIEWFNAKLNETITAIDKSFVDFRISEALMSVYRLFWDDFASWYLEAVKPPFGEKMDTATHKASLELFDKMLHLLHPFMPFLSEEIWQLMQTRQDGESIMLNQQPSAQEFDTNTIDNFEVVKQVVSEVRRIRAEKNIPFKEQLVLQVKAKSYDSSYDSLLVKLLNLSAIETVEEKAAGAASFLVKATEYFVPLGDLIDTEAELKKLKDELEYQQGFLKSVMKKLGNERFVNNAPEAVVAKENKKKEEAEGKIKAIQEQMTSMQ